MSRETQNGNGASVLVVSVVLSELSASLSVRPEMSPDEANTTDGNSNDETLSLPPNLRTVCALFQNSLADLKTSTLAALKLRETSSILTLVLP